MKNLVWMTAIATTAITLLLPGVAKAQSVIPSGVFSSTTIYTPPIETTTTTPVSPNLYPSNESYFTTSPNDRRSYRQRYRQSGSQTVIIQQNNNIYTPATPSRCSTTIIGSPIPSPIPLDRSTGQPCP